MANFQAHPPQGQKLPDDWKIQAEKNRREFDEAYKQRLESQWRQPQKNHGLIQSARLRPTSWDDVLDQK